MGLQLTIILGGGFYAGCWFIKEGYTNPSTDEVYNSGDIISVFLIIIMATRNLAHVGQIFAGFADGRQAAFQALKIITR